MTTPASGKRTDCAAAEGRDPVERIESPSDRVTQSKEASRGRAELESRTREVEGQRRHNTENAANAQKLSAIERRRFRWRSKGSSVRRRSKYLLDGAACRWETRQRMSTIVGRPAPGGVKSDVVEIFKP
ncbi:hypothetical protein [Variovorax fucosicus]|uniref:hypothetical protein n=1 Tax=Variovorax fucosicus TaxID=3053517 RepID=UPI00257680C4|nr:hypothetical protein [Variovorax sp. J22G47]MDM0058882.1 hypothetical protein [Variovorax sp. J22G47]